MIHLTRGRAVHLLLAAVCAAVLLLGVVALAVAQEDSVLIIDTGAPVYASTCKVCHGVIAEGRNPQVEFSHATHMVYACSSCHGVFPHTPAGTLTPTMKSCWNCHGLRHGPMGIIAGYECEQCHGNYAGQMRPEFHGRDWAEEPHVQPGIDELRTTCMMCHTKADCDSCHQEVGVTWRTAVPFTYDAENGCLACHGYENLTKVSEDGLKSYYVTGIDQSAHRDITCSQCHPDFDYTDDAPATPLWRVNAGLACQECHDHQDVTEVYEESLHGRLIADGEYSSATCASCHGGHDIARLDTEAARRALHLSGEQMCAECHREAFDSYDDYYHGAPYKRGAVDAPSCWDCHGAHELLAVTDPAALMYPANAVETCGQDGCHYGSGESFIEQTSYLIHGRSEAVSSNPIIRWWRAFRGRG
ncbi:MAG: hypothetical protein RQ731_05005 [Anaerosomatales bacterium]|nr:hypothetical protein [Anaerosomatales bacterium]MDT8434096.1 hypothetical protein [Anaerosomatales bacterium]